MPFIESSKSLRAQAHMSDVKTPVLIGILVLLGMSLMFFGGNIVTAASGTSFEIESSATQRSTAEGGSSAGEVEDGTDTAASSETSPMTVAEVFVFVSGAVQNPGVYKLPAEARVGDAVNSAGGFTEGAASDYNNLARLLVDGEQIHVPLQSDVEAAQGGAGQVAATPQGAALGGTAGSAPGGTASGQGQSQVNINTATQAELETLPGIGPATAQKIIASRESEGPFSTPDELMRVSGIGEKKYEAVEGLICV